MEAAYTDQHFGLVVECKQGNRKAQYQLYRLYSKGMFNVAMRIVNDPDEAADVLQEAFLDAFYRIADFRQETTFGFWMKQIVVNRCISFLRKKKPELLSIEDEATDIPEEPVSEDEDDTQWRAEQVRKSIQELPDRYRIVLSLYLLEGYDHEEISHILRISESTSRTQFLRARRKLVQILNVKGIKNK